MRPDYISFDTKQREELLSQTGNFSPPERSVFHLLCQHWQERIPYERFVSFLNHDDGGTTADLLSLMGTLRQAHMGILRTSVSDGQRSREAMILTNQDSPVFFAELADEYFTDMLESILNPLPLVSTVEDEIGSIPRQAVQPVSPHEIGAYYSGKQESDLPLVVTTLGNEALLVTQKRLRPFVNVAILKMRYFMSNTTLLGALAKLQDTSLLNLKQQCAGKDPTFWLALTKSVVDHRRDLETMRSVSVNENFFHAAVLLKNLIESQIAEAKQKKEAAENRQLDLNAIAMAVKETPEQWIDQSALTELLERQKQKYGDQFESFREEFYERYVKARGKNTLPKIVLLNRKYIHRDNIFPLFLQDFRTLENELASEFARQMEEQLKSAQRSKDSTFYSISNFNEAIAEQVRVRSEFVSSLVAKPAILAEAMILHIKQNQLAHNVEELKQRLSAYFDPDTMQPLPLNEWFNLRPLDLFEKAFEKLPIIKRIWIRITGKYESYRGRYLGQTAIKNAAGTAPRDGRDGARDSDSAESGARRSPRADRSGAGKKRKGESPQSSRERSSRSARPDAAAQAAKRAYSRKQVDSAWDEFGNTIKKDP
ncbi:MAG TPA: hypothetical protein VJ932_11145 [Alkalispirochaeta sp.]|nr:hypothetical protein [Alkalispirochaeta sp.]